jgi:outer membrane immunogenic protein
VFVATANTWAGFYLGAQVGYGWSKSDGTGFNAAGLAIVNINSKPKGIFGGLHAGYNWQRGALVYGVDVDAEISGVNKNEFATTGFKNDGTWRGSARLRMGYAFDPVLLYVTGGLAVRDRQFTVTNGAGAFFNAANNNFGWTLGAGAEFAVNNNWSVRAEYRYSDFGISKTGGLPAAFAPLASFKLNETDHAVRVGVSYRFGGSAGPVIAKY